MTKYVDGDEGVSMVADLPDDTVAAIGFAPRGGLGPGDGRLHKSTLPEDALSIDDRIAQMESETGLDFPEDVETLLGEGVTISMGSGFDLDAIVNGGPGELPVGVTIKGDPDEIQARARQGQATRWVPSADILEYRG